MATDITTPDEPLPEEHPSLLAEMSPEDRGRWYEDYRVFGRAVLYQSDDGSVVYVPPSQWLSE